MQVSVLLIVQKTWHNPQNKSKVFNKEPCKQFRPEEFEDHCRTSQHMNVVSAEMLQGDSVFQRTLDEWERVAEDVLLKVFTAAYWIMKEELPNNKIKSHVSPWAYMHSRFGGLCVFFTSLSPCRKDKFAVSYFSTSLIVLIQVNSWEIQHHSLVWCCGLADIYIFNNNYPATWNLRKNLSTVFFFFSFLDKIRPEVMLSDVLTIKEAFLEYKDVSFSKSKKSHFIAPAGISSRRRNPEEAL